MTTTAEVGTLIIRVPVQFKRRGGRKLIITPEGATEAVAAPANIDDTLVKTLVKAHRWRRRLETGKARSMTDLAEQEKMTIAYVAKLWPLTCLAPDIVAANPVASRSIACCRTSPSHGTNSGGCGSSRPGGETSQGNRVNEGGDKAEKF